MKVRRQLLFVATLALLVTAIFLRQYFAKPKHLGISDLATTQGRINSYSLLDDSRGTHQYTIRLSEYEATFQIPKEFADYFAKSRFESDLKTGDTISLSIPADSAAKLISKGTIPVFAVRTTSTTYLEEHDTIAAYNNDNKPTRPVPSLNWLIYSVIAVVAVVLLSALGYGIYKLTRILKARSPRPKDISDPGALDESSQRIKKCLAKTTAASKSLTLPERKLLTMGDYEPELITAAHSESESADAPPS